MFKIRRKKSLFKFKLDERCMTNTTHTHSSCYRDREELTKREREVPINQRILHNTVYKYKYCTEYNIYSIVNNTQAQAQGHTIYFTCNRAENV